MSKKVLIVEDQPDSRRLMIDILSHLNTQGITILSAKDGLEAYGIVQQEKPDLILLDIMLPGMSGYDLCEKVKSDSTMVKTHIIVVSARFQLEDRQEAIKRGADDYLVKPFDVPVLLELVQNTLGTLSSSSPTPSSANADKRKKNTSPHAAV